MAPGSLIPLLTLGIPGSPPAAVILGALMLHGMQPGVELFSAHSSVVYAFIVGLAVAAFAVLVLGTLGSFVYARIINIPSRALAPAILVLTVLGSYAIRNNMLDVWVMLMFGVIGFVLTRLNYHPAPLVLGFILGPYIEDGIVQSTMIGGASGNVLAYMTLRPICIVLIVLCVVSACWPLLGALVRRRQPAAETPPALPSDTAVNTDLVIGFVTIATALVVFVNTRELSLFGGLFVEYCVIALAVLGLVTVVKGFVRPERSAFFESSAERNRVMAGTGILAGYLFALPYLGFLAASICFLLRHAAVVAHGSGRGAFAGARRGHLRRGVRGAVRAVSLRPAGAAADRRVGILNATTPRGAGFVRQRPGLFSRTTTPSSRAGRR